MIRVLIHVEGQTEESFVTQVLAPHLYDRGYVSVRPRLLGNARPRKSRGGIPGWDSARRDILSHLKEDSGCLSTTMVDYYGMPRTGPGAWPGREAAAHVPFLQQAVTIQDALLDDISGEMGSGFERFIPYVVMHEFEGLLFSDCTRFARGINHDELAQQFQAIRDEFDSPEEINDSPTTAPSKRVELLVPGYQKPLLGTLAALDVGLATIRAECPHFNSWLGRLEASI